MKVTQAPSDLGTPSSPSFPELLLTALPPKVASGSQGNRMFGAKNRRDTCFSCWSSFPLSLSYHLYSSPSELASSVDTHKLTTQMCC